jgi:peptidoglycan-associated lipoprotein
MGTTPFTIAVAFVASFALLGVSGCSKKSVQSGGDTQSSQQSKTAKSESTESSRTGVGNFPDTSMQSGGGSGLRGLDKNPSEERIGAGNGMGAGSLLAKADTSDTAARQMDDIRAEQAASAAAGLRDVFFGYDSWTISDDQRQALNRDADWMKSNSSAMVKVEGHCDERGTTAYNLVLGEKRAKAVRNYLVELGISANRLSVVSYGKERPSCMDHAESCYQQNRRGHLAVKAGK